MHKPENLGLAAWSRMGRAKPPWLALTARVIGVGCLKKIDFKMRLWQKSRGT